MTDRAAPLDDDANPAVLSIGVVAGGVRPNPKKWGDAAMALSRRVIAVRESFESPLHLNVVFQISGEVVSVDWEGVRAGRYDSKTRLLMVQATVPADPPGDPT